MSASDKNDPRKIQQLPPIDFSQMVISFGTSALINLGAMPDPETEEVVRDLAAAKQTIDMLGMLQEKTRGNLTHEEDQLLSKLVLDLRLAYVKACPECDLSP